MRISEQLVHAMMNQGLTEQEARSRFYLVDRYGLLHDEMKDLLPFQKDLSGLLPACKIGN